MDEEINTATYKEQQIPSEDVDDDFRKHDPDPQIFKQLSTQIANYFFGSGNDKIIEGINSFAVHLYNIRTSLVENHYPTLIANLVYFPFAFLILLLNAIRMELAQTIAGLLVLLLALFILGVLRGLIKILFRFVGIYRQRFGDEGMEEFMENVEKNGPPPGQP